MEEKKEISEKERRIRAITLFYYSNPKIQEALLNFAKDREVVPRYFEGFGKRPDILQYSADIVNLVKKGATSFHSSEELWNDPLQLSPELSNKELNDMRKGWDLLIDIDSQFLDFSKIAAKLLIDALEAHDVKDYGIKFSGSKGFHIIVPKEAFPSEFLGIKTKEMFPEWPRAICQYLEFKIKEEFNSRISTEEDIKNLQKRTNKKREEIVEFACPECGAQMLKDKIITLRCKLCKTKIYQKKSILEKKRVLRCSNDSTILAIIEEKDILECPECKTSTFRPEILPKEKISKEGKERIDNYYSSAKENIKPVLSGGFDLVLVAPRHLFRMPYSLHEKTSLSSIVLSKNEIESFSMKNADAMKVSIREFLPRAKEESASKLLGLALEWKKNKDETEEHLRKKNYENKEFKEIDAKKITEEMFPLAIKKLLNGLSDGRKRGLFILITFFRSLNFSQEYIEKKIREWNSKNQPPLKEGYIKSQIDWHLKQRKKILPPNYSNENFYKDLGLIDKMPDTKNPLVDTLRKAQQKKNFSI